MELKAYAKINWDLYIPGKRPDNYHAIDTVMVNVSLHDTLRFAPAADISMTCSDPSLPTDGTNLVIKAAHALARASGVSKGVRIELTKNIPAGGGMGGGSSDGACALMGLNRFWGLNWPVDRLQPLAAELGSDVAFFLYGGWCRCRGRGEIVERLSGSERWPNIKIFLILPALHVATPSVYKCLRAPAWDGKGGMRDLTEISKSVNLALDSVQLEVPQLGLANSLSKAAREVEPRLIPLQELLERLYPKRWLMSGSGAVHFVVPPKGESETQLREGLRSAGCENTRVLTATTFTP